MVPNAWIARELHLGHVSRVNRCQPGKMHDHHSLMELLAATAQ